MMNQQPTPSAAATAINGPRSKCDQVVYEAIAKSCEIVVRGRCDIPTSTPQQNNLGVSTSGLASGAVIVGSDRPLHGIYSPQRGFHKQYSASAGLGGGGGGGGNGSRFNLEVSEVDSVRYVATDVMVSFYLAWVYLEREREEISRFFLRYAAVSYYAWMS